MQGKTVFVVYAYSGDAIVWMGVIVKRTSLYALAKLHGRIAEPNINYKGMCRRLQKLDEVRLWDRSRFGSEEEARYHPKGSYVLIQKSKFYK